MSYMAAWADSVDVYNIPFTDVNDEGIDINVNLTPKRKGNVLYV